MQIVKKYLSKLLNKRAVTIQLFFFTLIVLSIYLPHINGSFLLDDYPNLYPLTQIKNQPITLENIIHFLAVNTSGALGRPVSLLSFYLQAEHWPNNPFAFKVVNLAIHLANGYLIFFITEYLLRPQNLPISIKNWLSVIVAMLWLIQPIHASTVFYTVQRMTLLMAFFSLLAIFGYLYGRNCCQNNVHKGLLISTLSIIIGTVCAIFSKENGILILLYVAIIELTLFTRQPQQKAWKYWLWLFIYSPLIIGGIYFLSQMPNFINAHATRNFSFTEHLLTEARILIDYLSKIILPRLGTFGLFFDDYPISKNLFSPINTLLSIIILSILFIAALIVRFKQPVFSFAILWFFSGHSLESTFIPLELYFEHRNYLPAFGIIFALCYYTLILVQRSSANYVKYCFVFLIIFYCTGIYYISFQEAALWNNSALQALTWQKNHPNSKRANALAAQIWIDLNQPLKADQQLQVIHSLDKQDNAAYLMRLEINCYTQHLDNKQLSDILEKLQFTKNENATARTIKELVRLWGSGKCKVLTYEYMVKLLTIINDNLSSGRINSHLISSFSLLHALNEQYTKAIDLLDEGIKQMPSATELVLLKIRWAIASKQYDLALSWIENARLKNNLSRLNRINFENQLSIMENDIYTLNQSDRNPKK